jgi:hypothetical protein
VSNTGNIDALASADESRTTLWNELLDAEMNECLWKDIASNLAQTDRAIKVVIALASSGSAVAAWGIWSTHPQVWRAFAGIATVLAIIQTTMLTTDRLRKSSGLAASWAELANDYKALWRKDPDLKDPASCKRFEASQKRETTIDESQFRISLRQRFKAQKAVKKARGI